MRTVDNPPRTEQVTFRRAKGERAKTVLLEDVRESLVLGQACIIGYEIDRDGNRHHGVGDHNEQRVYVLELALISKRVPVVMDLDSGDYVNV